MNPLASTTSTGAPVAPTNAPGEFRPILSDTIRSLIRAFERALDHADAASTPRVPVAIGRRVVPMPITFVVGELLGEDNIVRLMADGLRRRDANSMRAALCARYVTANADALNVLGWCEQ